MTSNTQDLPDLSKPISSQGLQPSLTNAVSRSSHVQDSPDDLEGSTVVDGGSYGDGSLPGSSETTDDKRPWYKKPSPWWMLTLMPISAMTLAGVNPSLLQVYTEMVCRDIRKPAPSFIALEDRHTTRRIGRSVVNIDLPEYYTVSSAGEHNYSYRLIPRSDDYIFLQSPGSESEQPSCASDPVVQAAVSKLLTALLTTQGILSCITAASWASLSDRLGRRSILMLTSSAVIACYAIFVAVYHSADILPGGYWVLLLGPIVYGLLGGSAGTTAATNAYISDCTPAANRASIFSLTLGLRFTGMAIGPTLNALLVRVTGTPIAALVLVIGTHVAYLIMMLFVVPESLPTEKRAENQRLWRESRNNTPTRNGDGAENSLLRRTVQLSKSIWSAALVFLRPLSIAGPVTVTTSSGRTHKDWSLMFIVISNGCASAILASYTSMFQFGAAMFGWTAVELGYWYSGIIAARAVTLTLFLPVIIKVYHYFTNRTIGAPSPLPPRDEEESSDATTPLLSEVQDANRSVSPSRTEQATFKAQVQARKTPEFDLGIAQCSLALEVICYALVPVLFSRRPALYIFLTILASCGAGFGPAIQALAVDLYAWRGGTETGRLFGVLSVVQTISSQILGPTIYGITYMKIVAIYPEGIFFVSVVAVTAALVSLLFVELPGRKGSAALLGGNDSA